MQQAITDFLVYLSAEKGLAQNTLLAYERDLKYFASFLKQREIHLWTQVKEGELVAFVQHMQARSSAASSIYRALMAIRGFMRYLKRERLIESEQLGEVESPKIWQLIPEVLSEEEVARLLQVAENMQVKTEEEKSLYRAILLMLYGTGLRVSELCQLNIQDLESAFVRIRGKGGKERLVPVASIIIQAVDSYLGYFRKDAKQEALFVSSKGTRLNRIAVWSIVKEAAKQAGITKRVSPHTLRHCFATHLLEHGADLRVIQEMMGHANIGTTDRYTQISHKHLTRAFDKFHPRP